MAVAQRKELISFVMKAWHPSANDDDDHDDDAQIFGGGGSEQALEFQDKA